MTRNQLNTLFRANRAFFIAVQDYRHVLSLETPVNDVKSLAKALRLDVHDFQVHEPLINPDKQALEAFIEHTMPGIVSENDRVVLYFAGHGIAIDETEQTEPRGYLLPVDAQREEEDSFVSMAFLHQHLLKLPCRHLLLVLDCCFAGTFQWTTQAMRTAGRQRLPKNIYRQRFEYFVEQPAWQVITSAAYNQQALDIVKSFTLGGRGESVENNSPFAAALLRALQEGAGDRPPADGLMTISEIFAYLQDQLSTLTHVHSQKPAFFTLSKHRQGEFVFLNPKVKLHLSDYRDDYNPYRGLQAYEYKHRDVFYGRERVVSALLEKLKQNNLLIVSGDSGTGKSSVVKAGVLPALEKQGYQFESIRPGAHPMGPLNAVLKKVTERENSAPVVLLVDQLEELITQYAPEEERSLFFNTLASLLNTKEVFQKIILTVRSDFETLFDLSPLALYWQQSRFPVPGFKYEELLEIIVQPMNERCIEYEEGLVEELIREVQNKIGGLPMLSFTLSELYERFKLRRIQKDDQRVINREDYKEIGGIVGALQKSADHAYHQLLNSDQQASLRHLMLRLVSLSGGEIAGRRAMNKELEFDDPAENERIAQVKSIWIEKRLLRSGQDSQDQPYIEPAHDALVRSWRQMQEWIQEHRGENILLLAKLGAATEDYHRNKENKEYLWDDNPGLPQFEEMRRKDGLLPNRSETAFLDRSKRLKRKNRNILYSIVAGVILSLAGVTGWAVDNRNKAVQANTDLSEKIVESGINSAVARKNEGQYAQAISILDTTRKLKAAPQIDSLIELWSPLQALIAEADSLNNINKMKPAIALYEQARALTPEDALINKRVKDAIAKRNELFDDYVSRANGFKNYSDDRYDTQREYAILYLEKALELKDDETVQALLKEWKK